MPIKFAMGFEERFEQLLSLGRIVTEGLQFSDTGSLLGDKSRAPCHMLVRLRQVLYRHRHVFHLRMIAKGARRSERPCQWL